MVSKAHAGKSAETCRKSDPLKPSREGSLCSDSTVFTFPLWSQQVSKMVAKSSPNGGPMLSKTSPERVSKKCSKNERFLQICGAKWEAKGASKSSKMWLWESLGTYLGPKLAQVAHRAPFLTKKCWCYVVVCCFVSLYRVSSILFLMCCSMVSGVCISKRSQQNKQSKQSNHRKARKASKACKVRKASRVTPSTSTWF